MSVEIAWEVVGQYEGDPIEHPVGVYSTRARAHEAKRAIVDKRIQGKRFGKCSVNKVYKTEGFLEELRKSEC